MATTRLERTAEERGGEFQARDFEFREGDALGIKVDEETLSRGRKTRRNRCGKRRWSIVRGESLEGVVNPVWRRREAPLGVC